MHKDSKIFVAGHRGLVGSAIVRDLVKKGHTNIIVRTRAELDLIDREAVIDFFASERPEFVFIAAAKVGGIIANRTLPVDFITQNLTIALNVLTSAHDYDVTKLLFLGSSCIYPRMAPQPIKEEYLLTSALEPTNDAYALAKIAGIRMCDAYRQQFGKNFISAMPTNLYGENDNYHPEHSHVLPGLIRRFHEAKVLGAKEVVCWGTGTPQREFLYADDLAEACVFLMEHYDEPGPINVGTGEDITIRELAETVKEVVGFEGALVWDTTKPDGTPRKLLDVSKIHQLGWHHTTPFKEGVQKAYDWYLANIAK